jgi:hypothetical protein
MPAEISFPSMILAAIDAPPQEPQGGLAEGVTRRKIPRTEHFQAKWAPVRVKKMRQANRSERFQIRSI